MSRTIDHALARRQLAPFKKGARVLLAHTVAQRDRIGTVERTVISRRVVCVRLDNGCGSYDAWPENLTILGKPSREDVLAEALRAIDRGLTNGQKERGETFQTIARAALAQVQS